MTIKDNIPASGNKDFLPPDMEKLLQYMSGKLSEADRIIFEKQLEENPMLQDALEGFQESKLQEPAIRELDIAVNAALWKQVRKRKNKTRHRREKASFPMWIYVLMVLMVLILCFLVFFI